MGKQTKKKILHKKHSTAASKAASKPTNKLLPYLLLIFTTLMVFVFVRSFVGTGNKITKTADFGGVENVLNQSGEWSPITDLIYFNNKIVNPPTPLAYRADKNVLSATSGDDKWIDISLGEQKLRAYEQSNLIYEFPVSTGLPWTPTVKGVFNVWYKIKYTRMVGGSVEAGNYYDLPNVPFNMFFHGDYAMHGAYWHNNFGHQMSHGCVNMRIPDAEKLFFWTTPVLAADQSIIRSTAGNPGTKVVVHD